jgi:hypothetical protein
MISNQCDLQILVKGRPVTEFNHELQTFIEGREGSEFEILVRNKTANRVMAVISVDGLSITDGELAGPESSGYTINAYQSITIPGWKLAGNQAAKFTFGSRSSSYVNSSTGEATNCGVIGLMLWSEKKPEVKYLNNTYFGGVRPAPSPWDYIKGVNDVKGSGYQDYMGIMKNGRDAPYSGILRGMSGASGQTMSSGVSSSMSDTIATASAAMDSGVTYGASSASTTTKVAMNNLGTEFGQATEFNTTSTTFNKDTVIVTLVMFYDDARGLKARGIVLAPPVQTRALSTPNPFPAMGCTPPKGWKG